MRIILIITYYRYVVTLYITIPEELGYFFEHLFVELDKANFFKIPEKRPQMVKNIMNIFTRIDKLSKNELQALRGVIRGLSGNNQTDKQ